MANEIKRMQLLAGLITESEYRESQMNEAEINPVTKKKFDNLLAMAEKAVASKDKESLQKIYDKALTTGSKGWKYFIQALYDKGLAHQDGAYLKWNLDESQMTEAKKRAINKYANIEVEDGEEYPTLNKKAISDYLKSVIDPKQVRAVSTFMNDEEGYGESAGNFFTGEDDESVTEKEIEDWVTMEMSYYLTSQPDEFPFKEN